MHQSSSRVSRLRVIFTSTALALVSAASLRPAMLSTYGTSEVMVVCGFSTPGIQTSLPTSLAWKCAFGDTSVVLPAAIDASLPSTRCASGGS